MSTRLPSILIYAAFLMLSVGVYILAGRLPMADQGVQGPAFFPRIVAVGMGLVALLCLVELFWRSPDTSPFSVRSIEIALVSLGYIGVIYFIGYYPATVIYCLYVLMRLRGERRLLRVLLETAALMGLAYLLFSVLLGAYMPTGVLFAD